MNDTVLSLSSNTAQAADSATGTVCLRSKRSLVRIQSGVPELSNLPPNSLCPQASETAPDRLPGDFSVLVLSTCIPIPLSQGKDALIDLEDYERVTQYNWCACWINSGWYAKSWAGGKQIYLHRFVVNAAPKQKIDHENGDTLDCRKSNLRLATSQQNACNRKIASSNTSGFKGVLLRRGGKYQARIRAHGREISLGRFADAVSAARAYDAAAMQIHGEFARLNFPGGAHA